MHTLGFNVHPYIGDRIEEGYGLSSIGIDKIKEKYDPALIITVDHGISGKDQVTYAKSIGIDVIVTDHHHRSEERVPTDAKAIFHIPALSGSGVAYYVAKEITEKLQVEQDKLQAASKIQQEDTLAARSSQLSHLFHSDFLALASIGTIADLVPLTGPSRAIAKYGLQALTRTTRPGLLALYKVAGHLGKTITPYEVGFQIAPRINASGRLDSALDALRLLCTTSATRAHELADKLNTLNQDRQDMTKRATEEAIQIVEKMKDANGTLPKLLIVYQTPPSKDGSFLGEGVSPSGGTEGVALSTPEPLAQVWHEGIIGLIASKLVEKYYRPVIVLTPTAPSSLSTPKHVTSSKPASSVSREEKSQLSQPKADPPLAETASSARSLKLEAVLKASARSISGFHLADFLARHQKLLLRYGGHAAAAGLSINSEQLEQFSNEAVKDADSLITTEMLEKTLKVDVDIPLKLATIELASKLETLEPYGMSNPRPVFQSLGIIQEIRTMGKENQHLKLIIQTPSPRLLAGSFPKEAYSENPSLGRGDHEVGRGVSSLSLLAFSKAAEYAHLKTGAQVKVVYTLDINEWQGNRTTQGKMLYLQSNL
jgi:single-stranded-DNA-specific exonuclease